jgi:hypothetical protein
MAREPKQQPSKNQRKALLTWAILNVSDKLRWLGDITAYDADAAIAEAAKKFRRDAKELKGERRRCPMR